MRQFDWVERAAMAAFAIMVVLAAAGIAQRLLIDAKHLFAPLLGW